jgi:hypothetical protein
MQSHLSVPCLNGITAQSPTVNRDVDRDSMPDMPFTDAGLQHLLERVAAGELLHPDAATSQQAASPGETPIEGAGAVSRWVALHDRARALKSSMKASDDIVAAHQVQRAVSSLFLYEHQLTAKTRRRARTALWQRDQRCPLPAFAERARWAACRCPRCQPSIWTVPAASRSLLLRTA